MSRFMDIIKHDIVEGNVPRRKVSILGGFPFIKPYGRWSEKRDKDNPRAYECRIGFEWHTTMRYVGGFFTAEDARKIALEKCADAIYGDFRKKLNELREAIYSDRSNLIEINDKLRELEKMTRP